HRAKYWPTPRSTCSGSRPASSASLIVPPPVAHRRRHRNGRARAELAPESGAQWIEAAGAYAMYDGVRSPCTQTFGLGLFQMPTAADMTRLEAFFQDHGAPVFHEVSPLAGI